MAWLWQQIDAFAPVCRGEDLASLTLPLPAEIEVVLPAGLPEAWWWTRPSDGLAILGFGVALRRELPEAQALATAQKALSWRHVDPKGVGAEPVAFIGHAFAPGEEKDLPQALLLVPEVVLRTDSGRTSLILSQQGRTDVDALAETWRQAVSLLFARLDQILPEKAACEPRRIGEMPDRKSYLARVAAARDAVAAGRLEKVVVSRQIRVEGRFESARLVASLAERYPSCAILSAGFGDRTVVAATPERLVRRRGDRIESLALAGTAPRSCAIPFPDHRLLASAKDRIEHAPVARHVAGVLAQLCDEVDIPDGPVLMELGGLQHLATPMSGRLKAGVGLLDAASLLHPTPAIAGWPRREALAMIAALNERRTGWYSGVVGWIDRAGEGELAVVLRTAVLDPEGATLMAGGGIVAASDPEAELAETELKLAAVLESLKVS